MSRIPRTLLIETLDEAAEAIGDVKASQTQLVYLTGLYQRLKYFAERLTTTADSPEHI